MKKAQKIYLIAGEDSGDLHASNLVKELKKEDPSIEFRGVGGDKLKGVGTELIAHVKDINFMGFKEVLMNIRTIRKLFRKVENDILEWKPDKVVLIDYPGFNLRIATFLKKHGIEVVYYISPQIWAWKKGRIKRIRRDVDKMLVILPFEKEFYKNEGMEVVFVGHPLLDVIPKFDTVKNPDGRLIALLPGSRKQEIRRILPVLSKLPELMPEHSFVLAGAPSQTEEFYTEIIGSKRISLEMDNTYEILKKADFAVVASGTATLETALFKVPEVVVYQASKSFYRIIKRIIKIPYISLVNLIMDRKLVEELIQNDFTAENTHKALLEIMNPQNHEVLLNDYQELRKKLGNEGASERAAKIILG